MTGIGKLFVMLNLFVTVSIAVWATSLYANRLNWLNQTTAEGTTIKGRLTLAQEELAKVTKTVADTSGLYGKRIDGPTGLIATDKYRRQRVEFYDLHLDRAKNGTAVDGGVFRNFDLVGGVGPLINIGDSGTPVTDPARRSLRGIKDIQTDLNRSLADADRYRQEITKARTEHQKVSAEIADLDARSEAQRTIEKNLKDEATFLGNLQINWDEEKRVLLARKGQLESRLKELGAELPKGR